MTDLSRRALLASVSAVALTPLAACNGATDAGAVEHTLAKHFGVDIAQSAPARRFAADFEAYMATRPGCANLWGICNDTEARIVQSFLESTTFLASEAGVADFDYVAIFDAWSTPCGSQLVIPLSA